MAVKVDHEMWYTPPGAEVFSYDPPFSQGSYTKKRRHSIHPDDEISFAGAYNRRWTSLPLSKELTCTHKNISNFADVNALLLGHPHRRENGVILNLTQAFPESPPPIGAEMDDGVLSDKVLYYDNHLMTDPYAGSCVDKNYVKALFLPQDKLKDTRKKAQALAHAQGGTSSNNTANVNPFSNPYTQFAEHDKIAEKVALPATVQMHVVPAVSVAPPPKSTATVHATMFNSDALNHLNSLDPSNAPGFISTPLDFDDFINHLDSLRIQNLQLPNLGDVVDTSIHNNVDDMYLNEFYQSINRAQSSAKTAVFHRSAKIKVLPKSFPKHYKFFKTEALVHNVILDNLKASVESLKQQFTNLSSSESTQISGHLHALHEHFRKDYKLRKQRLQEYDLVRGNNILNEFEDLSRQFITDKRNAAAAAAAAAASGGSGAAPAAPAASGGSGSGASKTPVKPVKLTRKQVQKLANLLKTPPSLATPATSGTATT